MKSVSQPLPVVGLLLCSDGLPNQGVVTPWMVSLAVHSRKKERKRERDQNCTGRVGFYVNSVSQPLPVVEL